MWAGLAHAILDQLSDRLPTQLRKEEFWLRLRLRRLNVHSIRLDVHRFLLGRIMPWVVFFTVLLFMSVILIQWNMFAGGAGTIAAVTGLIGQIIRYTSTKNLDLTDQFDRYVTEPDYASDLGYLHHVDEDIDRALDILIGNGRLAIFIDDLDRCAPDTVSEVILAINHFLSVQTRRVIFILGVDMDVVA